MVKNVFYQDRKMVVKVRIKIELLDSHLIFLIFMYQSRLDMFVHFFKRLLASTVTCPGNKRQPQFPFVDDGVFIRADSSKFNRSWIGMITVFATDPNANRLKCS